MIVKNIHTGLFGLFFLFVNALCKVGNKCNSTLILTEELCDLNELCDSRTETCKCRPKYELINELCTLKNTTIITSTEQSSIILDHNNNQENGSFFAGILIPLILVSFVILSIYISKRFELIKWLRDRRNQRNRNYDEFMIGQDDDDDDDDSPLT